MTNRMTTTHYYFEAKYNVQLKNKLQQELYEYLLELNGLIIEAESVKAFVHNLNKKAEELSKKHSRCRSINLGKHKLGYKKSIYITGFEQMHLILLGGSLWYMTDCNILKNG